LWGVPLPFCAVIRSLAFHGLISLLTLSSASSGGKAAGAKSHTYGFTMILCTVHFGIFVWMLTCPQCFAEDVLNYETATVSSAALFANIRLERYVLCLLLLLQLPSCGGCTVMLFQLRACCDFLCFMHECAPVQSSVFVGFGHSVWAVCSVGAGQQLLALLP
jgi:hypothetical protein